MSCQPSVIILIIKKNFTPSSFIFFFNRGSSTKTRNCKQNLDGDDWYQMLKSTKSDSKWIPKNSTPIFHVRSLSQIYHSLVDKEKVEDQHQ